MPNVDEYFGPLMRQADKKMKPGQPDLIIWTKAVSLMNQEQNQKKIAQFQSMMSSKDKKEGAQGGGT